MSDEMKEPESNTGGDVDAGEPISVLGKFEQNSSPAFIGKFRRKIYRRTAASYFVSFSFDVPKLIFQELWNMLAEILNPRSRNPRGGPS